MRLKGKRAFISGAGQGIGRETALQFAREGADVHATDINPKSLADLEQADNSIRTSILDVTDAAAVSALLGSQSAFDVVFNCAGYVANGTIQDCDPEDWRRSFQINVYSMYFVCKAGLPAML